MRRVRVKSSPEVGSLRLSAGRACQAWAQEARPPNTSDGRLRPGPLARAGLGGSDPGLGSHSRRCAGPCGARGRGVLRLPRKRAARCAGPLEG